MKIGETGRKAERKAAKRQGADLIAGSGCSDLNKGDARLDGSEFDWLLENKATEKNSYSLKYETLLKILDESRGQGRLPALTLQFATADGNPRKGGAWVVIPEWVWQEMLEKIDEE